MEVVGDMPQTIDSDIVQTYLVADPDSEVRLRRRIWPTVSASTCIPWKKTVGHNQQVETERQVSNALYESLLSQSRSLPAHDL